MAARAFRVRMKEKIDRVYRKMPGTPVNERSRYFFYVGNIA